MIEILQEDQKKYYARQFKFFMLFVVGPFIAQLYATSPTAIVVLNALSFAFDILLIYFEVVEIKAEGFKKYSKQWDNMVDMFMISTMTMYNIVRMYYPVKLKTTLYTREDLPGYISIVIMFTIIVMVAVGAKSLFYFKTFEKYGKIVALIYGVRQDV